MNEEQAGAQGGFVGVVWARTDPLSELISYMNMDGLTSFLNFVPALPDGTSKVHLTGFERL